MISVSSVFLLVLVVALVITIGVITCVVSGRGMGGRPAGPAEPATAPVSSNFILFCFTLFYFISFWNERKEEKEKVNFRRSHGFVWLFPGIYLGLYDKGGGTKPNRAEQSRTKWPHVAIKQRRCLADSLWTYFLWKICRFENNASCSPELPGLNLTGNRVDWQPFLCFCGLEWVSCCDSLHTSFAEAHESTTIELV